MWLGRAFDAVEDGGDGGRNMPKGETLLQEMLLVASKCLGAMMHNCAIYSARDEHAPLCTSRAETHCRLG